MEEFVEFLRDLKDETLSETNHKKRLILLKKYGDDNDGTFKVGALDDDGNFKVGAPDDDTGGYAKINVDLLRKPLQPAVDRSSKRITKDIKYEEEEEEEEEEEIEEEEEEESDDDDEDVDDSSLGGSSADSHHLVSLPASSTTTNSSDKKRNSMWNRSSVPHTDVTHRSLEGVLYKKNKLNHKKYYAVVVGQHLLLSHHAFDNNNNNNNKRKTNTLKVNKDIDLDDYDVSVTSPNGGKSELKLVCPGKKTHVFYCKEHREAEMWENEIKRASKLKYALEDRIEVESVSEECSVYVKNDVYEMITDKKTHKRNSSNHSQLNNTHHNNNSNNNTTENIIFPASEILTASSDSYSASFAKVTTHQQQLHNTTTHEQQLANTSTHQQQHKKGKKSKIQSLFEKVKKITSKAVHDDDDDAEVLISGVLELSVDACHQCYCYVKENLFQAHKLNDGSEDMISIPLVGGHVSLMPCSDWLVLLLRSDGREVQLKYKSHSELTKWYQVFVDQCGKTSSEAVSASVPEVLYDEIREVYNHDHMKANKRPALPECPAPITPDVNQVLMNINECSYMDAIECRGLIRSIRTKERIPESSSDDNTYANSGETTIRAVRNKGYKNKLESSNNNKDNNNNNNNNNKDNNNNNENIYNNMSGQPAMTATTTLNTANKKTTEPKTQVTDTKTQTKTEVNTNIETDSTDTHTYKQTDKVTVNKADVLKESAVSKTNSNCAGVINDQIANKSNIRSNFYDNKSNNKCHLDNNKKDTQSDPCKHNSNNNNNNSNNNNSNNNNNNSNKNLHQQRESYQKIKKDYGSEINKRKSVDTCALINKFSGGGLATTTKNTTTTTKTTTTTTTATKLTAAKGMTTKSAETTFKTAVPTKTTKLVTTSLQDKNLLKLSISHTSLLRLPSNDNNIHFRSKSLSKRYSDTSAMKGSLILEKIKMFENRNS